MGAALFEWNALELEPSLQLNHTALISRLSLAELTCIQNVRRRQCHSKVRQIQDIEGVKEISSEYQSCLFSQHRHAGQEEALRQREIDVRITWSEENVAAAASRSFCSGVEFRFRIREDPVNELLLRGVLNYAAEVGERIIRASIVAVAVIVRIAAPDRSSKWVAAVPGCDCADAPASKEGAQQIVTVAENRRIVHCGSNCWAPMSFEAVSIEWLHVYDPEKLRPALNWCV